ncbi:MAG: type II toxin-antitoxin system VapC family toxin [Acidobacteria bacterium]|nr:type II toxin-antitoxin system VapC family toxin [Acidobacteriota bacterium]
MTDVVVDTNIVIWYFTNPTQLTKASENAIDSAAADGTIFVSSVTIVELIYLIEKAKVRHDVLSLLQEALDDSTTAYRLIELDRSIAEEVENIPRSIVADMPDRIIAATALHLGLPLVTSDRDIQKLSDISTIW